MILFPAIDISGGKVVRLYKGDYDKMTVYEGTPAEIAKSYEAVGATHLHVVDLDGAKDAKMVNKDIYVNIAKNTDLKLQVGGGIRNLDAVEYYLSSGVSRVILGSVAVKDPEFVKTVIKEYGSEKITVGIDAKNGMVASEGWLDTSDVNYLDLAKAMCDIGVSHIIFTDISKDGTLSGPNLEQLDAINKAVKADITASGGIKDIGDIMALCKMNMYGAICGKSLYGGTLDLTEAIKYCEQN